MLLEELIRAAGEGDRTQQPETVLAMLQARLSRFSAEVRSVSRAASIFGVTFWRGGVAALLESSRQGADGAALDDWLATLVEAEVIEPRATSRFPGEKEYGFRHALIREAAYSLLTAQGVATGHLVAARYLEQLGETEPLILAEHYRRAEDWDKTLALYLHAAETATRLSANHEARRHYAAASAILATLPETSQRSRQQIDILLRQVQVGLLSDGNPHNVQRLDEVKSRLAALRHSGEESADDLWRQTWAEYLLARIHYYSDQLVQARQGFEALLPAAEILGDKRFLAVLLQSIGSSLLVQGVAGESLPWLARGYALQEHLETDYDRLRLASTYAAGLSATGAYLQGMELADKTLATALASQRAPVLSLVYVNRASMLRMCGLTSGLLACSEKALAAAQRSGDQLLVGSSLSMLGWACVLVGRIAEGIEHRRRGKQIMDAMGGRVLLEDWFVAADCDIALRAGQYATAIALAEEHLPAFRQKSKYLAIGLAEQSLGLALGYRDLQKSDEADAHLDAALQLMERMDQRLVAATLRLEWARLCRRRGDDTRADALRKQAAVQCAASSCSQLVEEVEKLHL